MGKLKGFLIGVGLVFVGIISLGVVVGLIQHNPSGNKQTSNTENRAILSEKTIKDNTSIDTLTINDHMVASIIKEKASDQRCFQRFNTIIDVDQNSWYGVSVYAEIDGAKCERDYGGLQYGVPVKLDILRANQDNEVEPDGSDKPLYTEYRLLNGTTLSFGEKEINHTLP